MRDNNALKDKKNDKIHHNQAERLHAQGHYQQCKVQSVNSDKPWREKNEKSTNRRSDSSGIKPFLSLESSYFFSSSIFNEASWRAINKA